MATLAHLAAGRPFRVLVVSGGGARRASSSRAAVVRAHTHRVVAEDELDRDGLVRDLAEAGYLRVPLVEDPGSFAVRGAPARRVAAEPEPSRCASSSTATSSLSIKPFDPRQKTRRPHERTSATSRSEVWLPPAREAILAREYVVARA